MEDEMYENYVILNKRLRFEQSLGTIKNEKEFLDTRDSKIRAMYPERFEGVENFFVCAECGKFEIATDVICTATNKWLGKTWETDDGIRWSLLGCCDDHMDKIQKRIVSYSN